MQIANRIKDVQEYYFAKKLREVAALNAAGKDVINLGIGSPDGIAPKEAVDACTLVMGSAGSDGYKPYKSLPVLREAWVNYYKKQYNVTLHAEQQVLPLIGSKEGILHLSMAYLNEGDEVLVPNPGYLTYASASKMAGAQPIYYDLLAENDWLPDFDSLSKLVTKCTKMMWVNYPNMPTGKAFDGDTMDRLIKFCADKAILLCHDNPYSQILAKEPNSILQRTELNEQVLELNSLSKSHNMAGWRQGVLVAHPSIIDAVLRFKSNMDSGMYQGLQYGAAAALGVSDEWYASLNKKYEERRTIVWQIMDALACTYDKSAQGLFVWGKVPESIHDVNSFCDDLLYKAHVFITTGTIFGSNGHQFIRISLCANTYQLNQALERINLYLHEH